MNAKINKETLKSGAVAAGLVAVLLPTGCMQGSSGGTTGTAAVAPPPSPGSASTVVTPPHTGG
jgi:hypothetical protein